MSHLAFPSSNFINHTTFASKSVITNTGKNKLSIEGALNREKSCTMQDKLVCWVIAAYILFFVARAAVLF